MQTGSHSAFARNSLGHILRAQRIALGLGVGDVASRLCLPAAIVEAMENDDRERLGAAVFARGRLCGYARLLELPAAVVDAHVAPIVSSPTPQPAPMARASRLALCLHVLAGKGMQAASLAAVAVPMIAMGAMHHARPAQASLAVLDRVVEPALAQPGNTGRGGIVPVQQAEAAHGRDASATPGAPVTPDVAVGQLQLRFNSDSRVDIVGADGKVIDRDVVEAGTVHDGHERTADPVVTGHRASRMKGERVDPTPSREAEQARFALSSRGQPTPERD